MFAQTQIAALLHEEHMHTIGALQELEEFLGGQSAKRVPDLAKPEVREILDGVLGGVAAEVERHFGFEENHLFPILAEQGELGIAHMLTAEHATILPLARELTAEARESLSGKGFTPEAWKDFHGRAMELCERETFHIQKEEMGLLAAIAMFVDSDADAQLAALYSQLLAHAAH